MFERFIVAGGRSLFEGMAEVLTDCQSSEEMSGVMDSTRAFYQLVVVSVAQVSSGSLLLPIWKVFSKQQKDVFSSG